MDIPDTPCPESNRVNRRPAKQKFPCTNPRPGSHDVARVSLERRSTALPTTCQYSQAAIEGERFLQTSVLCRHRRTSQINVRQNTCIARKSTRTDAASAIPKTRTLDH